MKIGIMGAGNIGSALAGHFHKLQHIVLIANSRGCLRNGDGSCARFLSNSGKRLGAMPHGFLSGIGTLTASSQALDEIVQFLTDRLSVGPFEPKKGD